MDEVVAKHIPVLVAPDKGTRGTPKRWLTSGRASWMRTVLSSEHGRRRYRKRKQTVEPLFGNTKHNLDAGGRVFVERAAVGGTHTLTEVRAERKDVDAEDGYLGRSERRPR